MSNGEMSNTLVTPLWANRIYIISKQWSSLIQGFRSKNRNSTNVLIRHCSEYACCLGDNAEQEVRDFTLHDKWNFVWVATKFQRVRVISCHLKTQGEDKFHQEQKEYPSKIQTFTFNATRPTCKSAINNHCHWIECINIHCCQIYIYIYK